MTAIAELDTVTTTTEITAQVVGESRDVTLPAGTLGTVVFVHYVGTITVALEVEFDLGDGTSAVATVSATEIVLSPGSDSH